MTRITVDASLSSQLQELIYPAELSDPFGRVLGEFVPAFDPSKWEPVGPEPTEEELQRRGQSAEESYTTEEVLAYLKSLGPAEDEPTPGSEPTTPRVTVDASVASRLREFTRTIQLCDPSGQLLGQLTPVVDMPE